MNLLSSCLQGTLEIRFNIFCNCSLLTCFKCRSRFCFLPFSFYLFKHVQNRLRLSIGPGILRFPFAFVNLQENWLSRSGEIKNIHPAWLIGAEQGVADLPGPCVRSGRADFAVNNRRCDDGRLARVRGHDLPYNPYLVRHFNCHINVEACGSIKAVKYLFKYI